MKLKNFILMILLSFIIILLASCEANKQTNKYKITYAIKPNDKYNVVIEYDENKSLSEREMNADTEYNYEGYKRDTWYLDNEYKEKVTYPFIVKENKTLYLKWNKNDNEDNITVKEYSGYNEGIYLILPYATNYEINYKLSKENNYQKLDKELIRKENNDTRVDILGLSQGEYDVKIKASNQEKEIKNIKVYEADRSGYAHFNYNSGVGAYNNDGTLKENTLIVYVTDETKNTVKATINNKEYVGLVNILQAQKESSNPLNIRILDTIKTAQWNSKTYKSKNNTTELENEVIASYNGAKNQNGRYYAAELLAANANSYSDDLAKGITVLNNLTSWGSATDSYWNMCDVANASNITIEGVGENAGIFQWGFTFKGSSSIEVKNLTFDSYTEDACSAEGTVDSTTLEGFKEGHIWIHNNTFKKGLNRWDVSDDQDKKDGDGATDFKKLAYVTVAYNHYIKNHKTGLVGGSDTQHTAALTFHHNFYDECQSRLPFARQANMHMYNNYYYASTGNNMQIYAGAYAFIENCYFKNVGKTYIFSNTQGQPAVKSYNNIYDNSSKYNDAKIVDLRDAVVANDNLYGKTFDTNSSIFYYDNETKKSNVKILNETSDVPSIVPAYAGAGANYYKSIFKNNDAIKYTITLMNENEVFKTISVYENDKASIPSIYPTKENKIFNSWVIENGNSYDWNTKVTNDLILYAKFTDKPSYESLKENTNILLNEDFNNKIASEKLIQFEDFSKKGIFGGTNGTDYTKAYATYTNTSVKTIDNDSGYAAMIYASTGENLTSGIIKGYLDLTISQASGSKWALVTFLDYNLNPLLKLGTDSSNHLSYALDNVALENGTSLITDKTVAVNDNYKIYYEFNLNDGTTTLIINDITYLNNIKTNIKSFAGFYTMTNGKGTDNSARIITLDNIIIVKEN